MIPDLPRELLEEAEDKYHSLCISARKKKIDLPEDKETIEELKRVFAFSDFVAKGLIRDPLILMDLLQTGDLKRSYEKGEYQIRADRWISMDDDLSEAIKKLRLFRTREMIRIAWRDLLGIADIYETMYDLSLFADACIDKSVSYLYSLYSKKFGTPIGSRSNIPQQLVVIGLGKLGGWELNFSSDVDLMFAYPESGTTYTKMDNDEFFFHLCTSLIKLLGEYTPEGFVFRVDTRLRPFGKNGPIVMNFDAMEDYYQVQGREWERYALIKSRIVAGDKRAGGELLNRLRPFVYRRYLDYTAFESLREMKQRIMNEIRQINILDDIKMGPGGIREIEFFVQIFQLIRGGVEPDLQTQNLSKAIMILKDKGYVPGDVCDDLLSAYIFLRRLENRLQEYNDLQTHKISKDPKNRLRLAISMGLSSWDELYNLLVRHSSIVHEHFNKLLAPREKERETDAFSSIWHMEDKKIIREMLMSAGFNDPERAASGLIELKSAPSTRSLGPKGRNLLSRLIPILLKKTSKIDNSTAILIRIMDLIKKIQTRTNYLSLMLENPQVIDHLIRLAGSGKWIISFVSKNPALLDELIDPRNLYTPPTKEELEKDMENRLKNIDPDDIESQMIQLCLFRQTNTLRVAAADIVGAISLMEVSTYLTEIAEVLLKGALKLAWNYTLKKLKEDHIPEGKGFCIIGYGKLGGRELGYGSDLDIVFLHTGDKSTFYIKVAQNMIHMLTTYTIMGKAYEVDTRLRPNGSSGILAVSVSSFREYQMKRAWTWEHQALLRARGICGDEELINEFQKIRYMVLSRPRDKNKLFKEIWDMREKIRKQLSKPIPGMFHLKYDPGGIIDIEFLIQYLVLLNASVYPELLRWTAHIYFVDELMRLNVVEKDDAEFLKDAYIKIRSAIHKFSLQERHLVVRDKEFYDIKKNMNYLWQKYKIC